MFYLFNKSWIKPLNGGAAAYTVLTELNNLKLISRGIASVKSTASFKSISEPLITNNNKKRSHTQLDSRKQVIAFQDRVITINIKEAQHPLK